MGADCELPNTARAASGERGEQSGPRHGKGCWMWPSGAGLGSGTNRFLMRDIITHHADNSQHRFPLYCLLILSHILITEMVSCSEDLLNVLETIRSVNCLLFKVIDANGNWMNDNWRTSVVERLLFPWWWLWLSVILVSGVWLLWDQRQDVRPRDQHETRRDSAGSIHIIPAIPSLYNTATYTILVGRMQPSLLHIA